MVVEGTSACRVGVTVLSALFLPLELVAVVCTVNKKRKEKENGGGMWVVWE
jgi:hypothetical protein